MLTNSITHPCVKVPAKRFPLLSYMYAIYLAQMHFMTNEAFEVERKNLQFEQKKFKVWKYSVYMHTAQISRHVVFIVATCRTSSDIKEWSI